MIVKLGIVGIRYSEYGLFSNSFVISMYSSIPFVDTFLKLVSSFAMKLKNNCILYLYNISDKYINVLNSFLSSSCFSVPWNLFLTFVFYLIFISTFGKIANQIVLLKSFLLFTVLKYISNAFFDIGFAK